MALPADRERMIEEIAEKHAERFREWEDGIWEHGVAVFGKAKPQDRLRWYMSQTLTADMGMVLDVDYREKLKQGLAGPLTVMLQFEQYQQQSMQLSQMLPQAEAESQKLGVPMPQIQQPVPPPMMWVQLMGMSGRFMQKVQRDFRDLLNQQAKREGLVESAPTQVQVPQRAGY
jgi:hypothetical protein